MHLVRTTIECEEDILISVIRRLPDGEYEIVNNEPINNLGIDVYNSTFPQKKTISKAMAKALAKIKFGSPVPINPIGTPGHASSIGMGAITGNMYSRNVGIVANENKRVKYINFYAYPNSDSNEFAREDRYNIPTRVLLLDDAINE